MRCTRMLSQTGTGRLSAAYSWQALACLWTRPNRANRAFPYQMASGMAWRRRLSRPDESIRLM